MTSIACRADFFDASALVKVFSNEPCSKIVQDYFEKRATKYTSPFCFYEALNIFKSKWLYKNQFTQDEYLQAAFKLTAWYGAMNYHIKDLDFVHPQIFQSAKKLVEGSGLDLSDAFQILSIKQGYFSHLINDSQTVLVTADKKLALVARSEGIRVWSVMDETPPS